MMYPQCHVFVTYPIDRKGAINLCGTSFMGEGTTVKTRKNLWRVVTVFDNTYESRP